MHTHFQYKAGTNGYTSGQAAAQCWLAPIPSLSTSLAEELAGELHMACRVKDVMTSLEQCFMLEKSLRLTFQTMLAIYKSGFTRVPVFEGDRQNIVAVMYAKDLILVDPDDSIQVGTVLSFRSVINVKHLSAFVAILSKK